MNQSSLHIDFERLTDFIGGMLADAEKNEITAHLARCPNCMMLKMRVEKFIGVMQSDVSEEVPTHILERSFDLFRERKVKPKKSVMLPKRISAFLDMAFSAPIPAFGLRSDQGPDERRFWIPTEVAEIDLRLQPAGKDWNVTGQVFGSSIGNKVVLWSREETFTTEMNDLCEFSLKGIPVGSYKMLLHFSDFEIEVPEINLGK